MIDTDRSIYNIQLQLYMIDHNILIDLYIIYSIQLYMIDTDRSII